MAVTGQASMDATVRYLVSKYSPKGKWVGWLMMAFREVKRVALRMYGDRLEMLPDNDVTVPKPRLSAFLAIFLFPTLFTAIGQAAATLFVAIFALIGVLAAIFSLPEVYGFEHDSEPGRPGAPLAPA